MTEKNTALNRALGALPCKIILPAFLAAYLCVVAYFGNTPALDVIAYAVSQLVFVFSMGFAAALLIKPNLKNRLEFIIFACFLGVLLNVVVYICVYAAGAGVYLAWFMFGVSALCIFIISKKKAAYYSLERDRAGAAVLTLTIIGLLIIILFQVILNNFKPDFTSATTYYQDQLFNMGNVSALAMDFPPMDIRNSGLPFNYHYLYNMFLAIYKNIFDISSFDLIYKLFPITQIMLFSSSFYLLFSRFVKNKAYIALLTFVILLCDQYLFYHVMWAAFGTTFGLALSAVSLFFFLDYLKNIDSARMWDKNFICSMIFLAGASFAKAPFALVLLGGYGIILIYRLIFGKNRRVMLVHGVIAAAVISVSVLTLIVGVKGYNGLTVSFASMMTMENPGYFAAAADSGISLTAAKLAAYPLYLAINYTCAAVGGVLLIITLIKYRKEGLFTEKLLFALIMLGLVVGSVTDQPGSSNMFFLMITSPIGLLAAVLCLKRLLNDKTAKKALKLSAVIAACAVIGISVINQTDSVRIYSSEMLHGYPTAALAGEPALNNDASFNCITAGEYEGMLFLRENTDESDIIAGDRYYYTPEGDLNGARYFYYTAFSERQFYLEGYNYTNTTEEDFAAKTQEKLEILSRAYQNDAQAIAQLKQAGVTYIVRSEFASPTFFLNDEFGEIAFGNDDIVIYKLK